MTFPKHFIERYGTLVDDNDAFLASLQTHTPKSFRVNTIKATRELIRERFNGYGFSIRHVPWYEDAFISGNLNISETIEHALGHIYIQELSSMLPPLLIRDELQDARLVIDATAAPGSKTTQLAALMENKNTIIANDVDASRVQTLRSAVERLGAVNAIITKSDFRLFPLYQADVVLLDAPCSAEGTIRDNADALSMWSLERIKRFASLQKQLIVRAFDVLRPGGILLYSTCTFAPEENEAVVSHLLEKRKGALEKIEFGGVRFADGIREWDNGPFPSGITRTVRLWPHHNNTGGFFIAKVRKDV